MQIQACEWKQAMTHAGVIHDGQILPPLRERLKESNESSWGERAGI